MIPLNEKHQIHLQKHHYELKEEMLRFHGEAEQKGLNILDAFSYYNDVCNKAVLKEETGLGSAKNRRMWESFVKENGRTIGGQPGRSRDMNSQKRIQQSWY